MNLIVLLCLLTLPLQQTREKIYRCTVVNFDPHPTLVCNDKDNSVLKVPYSEWPREWHGPEMGFAYQIRVTKLDGDTFEGKFIPSQANPKSAIQAERNAQKAREMCGARRPPKARRHR